jgi:hypothetical protein
MSVFRLLAVPIGKSLFHVKQTRIIPDLPFRHPGPLAKYLFHVKPNGQVDSIGESCGPTVSRETNILGRIVRTKASFCRARRAHL